MDSTNYFEGQHNFKDILLGFDLVEQLQKEGRWSSQTSGDVGDMDTPERQVVQWEGDVH